MRVLDSLEARRHDEQRLRMSGIEALDDDEESTETFVAVGVG